MDMITSEDGRKIFTLIRGSHYLILTARIGSLFGGD